MKELFLKSDFKTIVWIGIKFLVIFLMLDQFVVCHPYNIQAVSFQDISG